MTFPVLAALILFSMISCCEIPESCRFCKSNQQGALFGNIQSKTDTSVRYSVYIPENTGDKRLPVVVFLDPHGKTSEALRKYCLLADQYQIALVGFDYSANGVAYDSIVKKFSPWLKELYENAPVDTANLYVAGFSGGARVASRLEFDVRQIKATALCGAGPSNIRYWNLMKNPVMFFSGTGDFNYIEMNSVHNAPEKSRTTSLHIFRGKHEWPPVESFEDFFILMNRLHKGTVKNSDTKILKRTRACLQENRPDLALYSAVSGLYALDESAAPQLKALADSIGKNIPDSFEKEFIAAMQKETEQQSQIQLMYHQLDTTRYKAYLHDIDAALKKDSLSLQADVNYRLKAYCGMVAYSFCNKAYADKSPNLYKLLKMYEFTEPENTDMLILFSVYYAGLNDCNNARIQLNKAKRAGFKDLKSLKKYSEFNNCEEMP